MVGHDSNQEMDGVGSGIDAGDDDRAGAENRDSNRGN
jgi:hypothetical protein